MFRRVVIAGCIAVIAVMGYAMKQVAFPSAKDAVQRYFAALQTRDLFAASQETASGLTRGPGEAAMGMALSDEHYQPPTGVRVGGWTHAPTAAGERVVAVQYELAGVTYSSLLKLRRVGGWRIVNGTGTIEINVPNALVNGQTLGPDKMKALFPGIYQVGTNPHGRLFHASPVEVAVTPDRAGTARLVTTLTTDSVKNVKQRMDEVIKACETTAVATKTDCPFRGSDAVGLHQVKWKVVSLPELTIEQSGPDSIIVRGVGPGSVRFTAVDAAGVGIDRVDSFSINGKCVEAGNLVSCTFSA